MYTGLRRMLAMQAARLTVQAHTVISDAVIACSMLIGMSLCSHLDYRLACGGGGVPGPVA